MAFSEEIKLEVKRRSSFRCCRCQTIGVEVHHIVPQAEGGPDMIDNAAPLCPNCHDFFGANPIKRKEIREMRDWWYQRIDLQSVTPNYQVLSQLNERVENLAQSDVERKEEMIDLKTMLKSMANQAIENLTPGTAAGTATVISDIYTLHKVPASFLKQGGTKHETLPETFLSRIKVIHAFFSDVLDTSLEETIDNFKRDLNPGREIVVWEHIMTALSEVTRNKTWEKNKKREALGILIINSSGPMDVSDLKNIKYLSGDEVAALAEAWNNSWQN